MILVQVHTGVCFLMMMMMIIIIASFVLLGADEFKICSVEADDVDLFRRQDIDLHTVLHYQLVFGFCVPNSLIRCANQF